MRYNVVIYKVYKTQKKMDQIRWIASGKQHLGTQQGSGTYDLKATVTGEKRRKIKVEWVGRGRWRRYIWEELVEAE